MSNEVFISHPRKQKASKTISEARIKTLSNNNAENMEKYKQLRRELKNKWQEKKTLLRKTNIRGRREILQQGNTAILPRSKERDAKIEIHT